MGAKPCLLGLAGWSGSGKTTLLCAVLPLLRKSGLRVSTIKHAHHALDLDQPGKDSFRHREAGAEEVLLVGGQRWAVLRETPDGPPDLGTLAARLAPVDLILVEGFKHGDLPRIEVFRPALGKPALWPQARGIVAVATDAAEGEPALAGCCLPRLNLNDFSGVASWIMGFRAPLACAD
jgi:molybdopterin-guanine dinucleotide biosynthesis protein B